ncbi:hypothetical protein [Mycolicibacterium sp. 050158]|nr:hypothetical protein [Mycolicibacterium sp. 050158]MDX1891644.1 hypothetical protein [Mycolicibacterium sp. 050158]
MGNEDRGVQLGAAMALVAGAKEVGEPAGRVAAAVDPSWAAGTEGPPGS